MPKFFCDYCDVYLTHDSMSVRKAHNSGRNHIRNVIDYYNQIGQERAQMVIDDITNSYDAAGQAASNPFRGGGGYGMPGGYPQPYQHPGGGFMPGQGPPMPFPGGPGLPFHPGGFPPGFPPGAMPTLPNGMPPMGMPPNGQTNGPPGAPPGMPPGFPPQDRNGMPNGLPPGPPGPPGLQLPRRP